MFVFYGCYARGTSRRRPLQISTDAYERKCRGRRDSPHRGNVATRQKGLGKAVPPTTRENKALILIIVGEGLCALPKKSNDVHKHNPTTTIVVPLPLTREALLCCIRVDGRKCRGRRPRRPAINIKITAYLIADTLFLFAILFIIMYRFERLTDVDVYVDGFFFA